MLEMGEMTMPYCYLEYGPLQPAKMIKLDARKELLSILSLSLYFKIVSVLFSGKHCTGSENQSVLISCYHGTTSPPIVGIVSGRYIVVSEPCKSSC